MYTESIEFLQKLRPNGPWLLIGILPDGSTIAITAHTAAEVDAFVQQHNGTYNLYYSVNPTKGAMNKKPAKVDIASVEYLLGDCDPEDTESPEEGKARYLGHLNNGFEPEATAGVDSGNGIHGLWKLNPPIPLSCYEVVKDDKGKPVWGPEAERVIADIEARSKALMNRPHSAVTGNHRFTEREEAQSGTGALRNETAMVQRCELWAGCVSGASGKRACTSGSGKTRRRRCWFRRYLR
jgi:hypothetical protein